MSDFIKLLEETKNYWKSGIKFEKTKRTCVLPKILEEPQNFIQELEKQLVYTQNYNDFMKRAECANFFYKIIEEKNYKPPPPSPKSFKRIKYDNNMDI